jgi:hypothetical protein
MLSAASLGMIYYMERVDPLVLVYGVLGQLAIAVMWYRSHMAAKTYKEQLELELGANVGLALFKSNMSQLKLKDRKMPSEILEEAVSGIETQD